MQITEKAYKVTYKTFYNDRLKKSLFHNKLIYPLYAQVIFDRIPIIFKSYYYDLFSKPKYAIRVAGQEYAPDIKEIIKMEKTLIEFIIDKNLKNFSLNLFKKEYAYYSRDLLDIMEEGFLNYLYTFFHDEGMPFIADTFNAGASDSKLYDLVQDLKRALNPPLYKRLLENSFYYAPPYLPLYAFIKKPQRTPITSITVMEWEQPNTKRRFADFFRKHYPNKNVAEIPQEIEKWVSRKNSHTNFCRFITFSKTKAAE
jgi:hypothetical protein